MFVHMGFFSNTLIAALPLVATAFIIWSYIPEPGLKKQI
jgi:hypothetical protein